MWQVLRRELGWVRLGPRRSRGTTSSPCPVPSLHQEPAFCSLGFPALASRCIHHPAKHLPSVPCINPTGQVRLVADPGPVPANPAHALSPSSPIHLSCPWVAVGSQLSRTLMHPLGASPNAEALWSALSPSLRPTAGLGSLGDPLCTRPGADPSGGLEAISTPCVGPQHIPERLGHRLP